MMDKSLTWRECAEAGMTQKEAAAARGVTIGAAAQAARRLAEQGIHFRNGRIPTRQDDEALLRRLRLRHAGRKLAEISREFGIPVGTAKRQLNNVRRADLDESGEPRNQVARAYW